MPQLFGMLIANTTVARISQLDLSSSRYSSRQRMTYANKSRFRISPVPEVECCQKLSCKPQISAANKGGIQFRPILKSECSLCSL